MLIRLIRPDTFRYSAPPFGGFLLIVVLRLLSMAFHMPEEHIATSVSLRHVCLDWNLTFWKKPFHRLNSDKAVLECLGEMSVTLEEPEGSLRHIRERSWRLKCSVLVKRRPQTLHCLKTMVCV